MTRTKSRIVAALLAIVAVIGASFGMAGPAAASPQPIITMTWEVLIGGTWTTIPIDPASEIQVPAGAHQSRFTITDITFNDNATLSDAWAGSTAVDNGGTQGLQLSSCPGYSAGNDIPLVPFVPLVCTSTYSFVAGHQSVFAGFFATFADGGLFPYENKSALYDGITDSATETIQATNGTGTFLASSDAALQTLPAGFTPQVKFSFTDPSATENLTGVTYSSTGTAALSSACPSLATTWVPPTGSGTCTVNALSPATASPQTITISAFGTGAFDAPTTTQSFTYAATTAACVTSATTYLPGSTGTISCTGFEPSLPVTATLHSSPVSLGGTTTGTNGALVLHFTIPKSVPAGTHTISIDSVGVALVTSDPITIGVLAETGVDVRAPFGLSVLLVLAGAVLLLYRRHHRALLTN